MSGTEKRQLNISLCVLLHRLWCDVMVTLCVIRSTAVSGVTETYKFLPLYIREGIADVLLLYRTCGQHLSTCRLINTQTHFCTLLPGFLETHLNRLLKLFWYIRPFLYIKINLKQFFNIDRKMYSSPLSTKQAKV